MTYPDQGATLRPMAYDPNKPPMSLKESEDLLKGSDDWKAAKAGWAGMFGELSLLVVVIGTALIAGMVLLIGGAVLGSTVAGLLGLAVALLWLSRRN